MNPEDEFAGPHFLVRMTDMPPTEVVCKCGVTFDGPEPLEDLKRHMEAENP